MLITSFPGVCLSYSRNPRRGYFLRFICRLETWKVRQERMKMLPPHDGIPGPGTARVIEAGKQAHGIWIPRPGDDEIQLDE